MAKITIVFDDDAKQILQDIIKDALRGVLAEKTPEAKEAKEVKIDEQYDTARAYAARLINTGKKEAVLDIIKSFGAAKISDIPGDKIAEAVTRFKSLIEKEG